MRHFLVLLFCLLLSLTNATAQGEQYLYGGSEDEYGKAMLLAENGDFIIAGSSTSLTPENDRVAWVVRTNAVGDTIWTLTIGTANFASIMNEEAHADYMATSIVELADGYLVAGTAIRADTVRYMFSTKIAESGTILWEHLYLNLPDTEAVEVVVLPDHSFAFLGTTNVHNGATNYVLLFANAEGQLISTEIYDFFPEENAAAMWVAEDGLVLLGNEQINKDVCLFKVNFLGDTLWTKTYDAGGIEEANAIIATTNGFTLAGEIRDGNTYHLALWEVGNDGTLENMQTHDLGGAAFAYAIHQTATDEYLIAGKYKTVGNDDALLVKIVGDTVLWWKNYGGSGDYGDYVNDLALYPNGIALVGGTRSFGNNQQLYLLMTDEDGNLFTHYIDGYLYIDTDIDCELDSFEETAGAGWIVTVKNATATYYTTTDAAGYFRMAVDTTHHFISVIRPNDYWSDCFEESEIAYDVNISTQTHNLLVQPTVECPSLRVHAATPFLRRGYESTYYISYCNEGTITAADVQMTLELDPYFNYLSSSIPATTIVGNLLTYHLGDIASLECGDFALTIQVDTTAIAGQTHCLEAHITPDTFCVNPFYNTWDGSSVEVEGACIDGEAIFTVSNGTPMEMVEAVDFIIIEDHVMTLTQPIQLPALYDTLFVFQPNGSTIRFEVEQSPGHPGYDHPSVTIEGCGSDDMELGIVNEFPLNDANPFIDIDCNENISSYDPNDKQAFPTGYQEEHYLEQNIDIEYLIRFQNTGNDTAFLVVLKDTLSEWLDVTTVRPGASSHSYDFAVSGEGILTFTFANIELPDSTTNEAASNGFVRFRISQKIDNPLGALIENDAAIYFDFNAPIITNTTFHQIGRDFIEVSIDTPMDEVNRAVNARLNVYPNPFEETANFTLQGADSQSFRFELYDVAGKLLRSETHQESTFVFRKKDLTKGIYFYQIQLENAQRITGKIILK